jgi:hypothetical protein
MAQERVGFEGWKGWRFEDVGRERLLRVRRVMFRGGWKRGSGSFGGDFE